jgi:hypothetical protein
MFLQTSRKTRGEIAKLCRQHGQHGRLFEA